jgi:hypothetical protein
MAELFKGRMNRRRLLQVGSLAFGGLTLSRLLQAEASRPANGPRPTADACIVLFLDGGPSHLDMWDMKPDTAEGIRGEFSPIASTLPGIPVSEHLPRLAKHMHRGTLIRSAHHTVNNSHAAAVYTALTGHDRGERGGGAMPDDYPAIGSIIGSLRPPDHPIVPFVSLPYITAEGAAFSEGCWGKPPIRCSSSATPIRPTSPFQNYRCKRKSPSTASTAASIFATFWTTPSPRRHPGRSPA